MKLDSSYQDYAEHRQTEPGEERMPLGLALLAMLGLSALGWGVVLVPLITTFNQ